MPNSPKSAPQTVTVLLHEQFSMHCLANAIEPLRAANDLSRRALYDWRFVTHDGGAVTSSSGLTVTGAPLREAGPGDWLLVVSSYDYRAYATPAFGAALRAGAQRFETVIGMDTGSWLMAAAGLLDGCRATIHWDELDGMAEHFPETEVVGDRFVIDGSVLTCGGATTTFDLILELIGQRHGPALRLEVAALFMHGERRDPADRLPRRSGSRLVDAAAALMRRNIEAPLSVPQIAARLGVTQSRLSAACRQVLGMSAAAAYRQIRMGEARRLLENTDLTVSEIAGRCGYADAAAFARGYRLIHGISPRETRTTGPIPHSSDCLRYGNKALSTTMSRATVLS